MQSCCGTSFLRVCLSGNKKRRILNCCTWTNSFKTPESLHGVIRPARDGKILERRDAVDMSFAAPPAFPVFASQILPLRASRGDLFNVQRPRRAQSTLVKSKCVYIYICLNICVCACARVPDGVMDPQDRRPNWFEPGLAGTQAQFTADGWPWDDVRR